MTSIVRLDVPFCGGRVWVGVHGNDRPGRPLLCVAGGPGMPHDYLEPLADLADERPIVFYDQLGCGRSTRTAAAWSRELLADELAAVRAALGPAPLHVLVHSSGGLFALDEILRQPSAYAGVILASVPVDIPQHTREIEAQIDELAPDLAAALRAGDRDPMQRGPAYSRAYDEYVRTFVIRMPIVPEAIRRASSGFNAASLFAIKGGLVLHTGPCTQWSIAHRLHELTHPLLVTCGRHDAVTPAIAASIAARARRGRAAVFERSTHMAHLEEPSAYRATLRAFLAEADAVTSESAT